MQGARRTGLGAGRDSRTVHSLPHLLELLGVSGHDQQDPFGSHLEFGIAILHHPCDHRVVQGTAMLPQLKMHGTDELLSKFAVDR